MKSFIDFELPKVVLDALERMGVTTPTPIQQAAIPLALKGTDLLASAQTGSGKTIAYLVPLLLHLIKNPTHHALVLTPTRELATQVQQALLQIMGSAAPVKTALLIGGTSMSRQIAALRKGARVVIGTPGRITDHLMQRTFSLQQTRLLVIDEADRMLDMGFEVQLNKIAEFLPKERQTLMFSATVPLNIEKLSKKYLKNPQRISIGIAQQAAPKIKHEILYTKGSEKLGRLSSQLDSRQGSVIIFVRTKRGADRLAKELQKRGHSAEAIHGDLKQGRRDRVVQGFRNQQTRALVATDIAARGLDVPHVMHVINYDLPQCPDDYIHRIGRTGRAGNEGHALCFISPEDTQKWKVISRLLR